MNLKKMNCTMYLSIWISLLCWSSIAAPPLQAQEECTITGMTELCLIKESVPQFYTYELNYELEEGENTIWIVDNGFIQSQTDNEVVLTWNSPGIGTIIAEIYQGKVLKSSCSLNVTLFDTPDVNIIPLGIRNVCLGNTIFYEETNACNTCTYEWSVEGVEVDIATPNAQSTAITYTEVGIGTIFLEVTETISGCSEMTSLKVTVFELMDPTFDVIQGNDNMGQLTVCANQDIIFDNTTMDIQPTAEFQWDITNGIDHWTYYGFDPLTFSFPSEGSYTVTLSMTIPNQENCSASTSMELEVQNLPPIDIICPSVVCEGDVITYSVDVTCSDYVWTVSDQGIIVADNGNSIDVEWSNVSGYEVGYVIFEGAMCDGNYCTAPSVQAVPIFPTMDQISGIEILCGNGARFFNLPNLPGAVYEWSFEVLSSNGGTVTESGPNNLNRYRLTFSNFTGIVEITGRVEHPIAGCSFEDTHIVEVFNNSITGPNAVCPGDPATFSLNPPTGSLVDWTLEYNGQPIYEQSVAGDFNIPAGLLSGGGLHFVRARLVGNNGLSCQRSYSFNVIAPANVNGIEGATEVCLNTPYVYSVDCGPNETIQWTVQQNGMTETYSGCTISVTWTEENGPLSITAVREINSSGIVCSSDPMTFNITRIEAMEIEITGNTTPCPDGTEIYCASLSGATGYFWEISPALGSVVAGQGTDKAIIQWLYTDVPTNVNITLTATLCDNPVSTTYPVVLTPFDLTISGADVCAGDPASFSSNATTGDAFQWYVDNEPVPTPQGTNAILNYVFQEPGYYNIRLEVINANDCPGNFADVIEVQVYDNPKPEINPIATLPCPVGTPFTRTLVATPNDPNNYTYTWFYNGNIIGSDSPELVIDETGLGNYQVQITSETSPVCTNISSVVAVNYDCDGDCCAPTPDIDFDLTIKQFGYAAECGSIFFTGSIDPFENAVDPEWTIVGPGFTIETIDINTPDDLMQLDYMVSVPGRYFIYLSGSYYCADIDKFCEKTTSVELVVPFLTKFLTNYRCGASGATYDISLEDMSNYFESPSNVTYSWTETYTNTTGSSADFNIDDVPAGSSLEVCLDIISGDYPYHCEQCETITVPNAPISTFTIDQMGLCEGQLIEFTPDMPNEEILELEWDFGDNSQSRLYNVTKVYTVAGTYQVNLSITSIYGCTVQSSQNVTIIPNDLDGFISESMMDCSATAELSFTPTTGTPIATYEWSPNGETSASIVAMTTGVYDVTVSDANGCTFSPVSKAVILVDPFPNEISGAPSDCSRIFLSINASNTYSYSWTINPDPTGISPVNGNTLSVFNLPAGVYEVTASAIGDNNTVCATEVIDFTIWGSPDAPILDVATNTCEPNTAIISVTNYPEVSWFGPNVPQNLTTQSIIVSQNGTYQGSHVDENGCFATTNVPINNLIDFSGFLSGCYEYCKQDFDVNAPVLFGIPGSFLAWEWRLLDDAGNLTVLDSGTGFVPDLPLDPMWSGKITLWVDNGDCQAESDYFCVTIFDCPDIDCDGFTIDAYCTTCSCGTPYGGARVYDSNGNLADPDVFFITWEVDGVIYNQTSINPFVLDYDGPTVFTAHIQYTSPDGSIVCDTTLSVETACGECPNYTFATCATIAGDYLECGEGNNADICRDGSGYVFITDAAGNPVTDANIDWFNDLFVDPNPFFLSGVFNCEPIPVRVFNFAGCDTLLYYEPDCCNLAAPEVYCNSEGEVKTEITWEPVCGTEFYEIELICLSGEGYYDPVIITEPGPSGNYTFDIPLAEGCDLVLLRIRGFCSNGQQYGEWSDCVGTDNRKGCFEWGTNCDDIFGYGLGNNGHIGQTQLLIPTDIKADLGPDALNVYPNPFYKDQTNLSLDQPTRDTYEQVQLRILDVHGKALKVQTLNTEEVIHAINMEGMAAGVYFAGLYTPNGDLINSARLIKATNAE